ncbi:carboxyl transferase domain-containing protein [Streptomyces sp. STR69]|uniref:carboxyl transferase domain-containing protein n=1 Tax=Streptomyces sp. STR69 TaxID=1796942 RepID=UPI003966F7BD
MPGTGVPPNAARPVRTCGAPGIPVVALPDVPGPLSGVGREHGAITRHGAKPLCARRGAGVPGGPPVLRGAYGGAYLAGEGRSPARTRRTPGRGPDRREGCAGRGRCRPPPGRRGGGPRGGRGPHGRGVRVRARAPV